MTSQQAQTQAAYAKPLPRPTVHSKPFWDAAKRHELVFQRCKQCGKFRHYPQPICPGCNSFDHEWVKSSGRGKVYSWTVAHRAFHPGFQNDLPLIIAAITIDDAPGVRVLSNITGAKPEEVRPGMPVEVWFDDVTPEITLPKFRPARG